jgi:hypothetical protein
VGLSVASPVLDAVGGKEAFADEGLETIS